MCNNITSRYIKLRDCFTARPAKHIYFLLASLRSVISSVRLEIRRIRGLNPASPSCLPSSSTRANLGPAPSGGVFSECRTLDARWEHADQDYWNLFRQSPRAHQGPKWSSPVSIASSLPLSISLSLSPYIYIYVYVVYYIIISIIIIIIIIIIAIITIIIIIIIIYIYIYRERERDIVYTII